MITLISDVDGTLLGDPAALNELNEYITEHRDSFHLIYATGRDVTEMNRGIFTEGLIMPDAAILSTGSEIYTVESGAFLPDVQWESIISASWDKNKVEEAAKKVEGLMTQGKSEKLKVSYFIDPSAAEQIRCRFRKLFKEQGIKAKIIISHEKYLDIIPENCDKGKAAEFLIKKLAMSYDSSVVAGDSENDTDLFESFYHGIVVGNARHGLRLSTQNRDFYMAGTDYAAGVLEGLKYYMQRLK
ncbi:MAG: HAD-IIB family hydrolase [Candidatus Goldbacteria bacterium]|nr:HAD-IIB family hydrolase [Candidatus Goldiibacteriota bacterium]